MVHSFESEFEVCVCVGVLACKRARMSGMAMSEATIVTNWIPAAVKAQDSFM